MTSERHSMVENQDHLLSLARQFILQGQVLEVREYGRGNVNDTFLVNLNRPEEPRFILQRLNTRVFRHPQLIMGNLRLVTQHVRRRLKHQPLDPGRRFELPRVLLTRGGRDHIVDPEGSFWRALSFISGAQTFDTIKDETHAREVGWALGLFHRLLDDLPADQLADTLPGFHLTPSYLTYYDEVLAKHGAAASPDINYCLKFVEQQRAGASVLEEAHAHGKLVLRPIHGDPKVNNFMIDTGTGQAVSLIDLDTVKPGLVHYDIGDCLRSGCNLQGEETEQWQAVRFEPEPARAILQGYFSQARDFLTDHDFRYLYDAIRVITFELGLRFFTDHLAGNVYFKVRYPGHNLMRALVQFKLTESIESQAATIQTIIRDLK